MIKISAFIFVNESFEDCTIDLCAKVVQWGAELAGQLNNIEGGTVNWVKYPEHENAQELGVTKTPTIVFINADTNKSITRISGFNVNKSNYQKILRELNTVRLIEGGNDADLQYQTESGFMFGNKESSFGILPFGLPGGKLFAALYLLGALFTGYKTSQSESTPGQVIYGSATVALINLCIQAKKT